MDNTEKAYIQGFYAALKGVLYIANTDKSTKQDIVDAVNDTLLEMQEDGDLEHIDTRVDELIDLVRIAESQGREDEFFEALDRHFGGK